MHALSRRRLIGALAVTALGLAIATRGNADDGDPPERVAMVDLVEGAAAAQPAGVGDWIADLANRPLTNGDKLWVDANSRAELHLGSAAIRLNENSGIQFLDVGDRVAQLRLSAGSMIVRLRYLSPDETFEVDTPNSAISLTQAGEYRIDVDADGDVVAVDVWRGEAEVAGQTQSFVLQSQQQGEFQGGDTLGVEFGDVPPADGFDQWAQSRDQREDQMLTANFLSRDVTGYADLDGYGNWQTDPELGSLWVPQVPVGWAPYAQGYWIWVAPWGWTWIDAAPWGFAPFHYGRWVRAHSGWAWSPGQPSVRPVYAPALVAWATGPNKAVAWFALGPNEIYRPSARVSSAYLRRVNVTNTYIDNTVALEAGSSAAQPHYANQAIPGAMIAVTPEAFTSGRMVERETMPIAAAQASLRTGNPLQPTAKSLLPAVGSRRRVAGLPPRGVFTHPVVVRATPPGAPGQLAEQRRVIVTTVPRSQARMRPLASPQAPAPMRREATPSGNSAAPRNVPARINGPVNTAPARADRPAVMPRPMPGTPMPGTQGNETQRNDRGIPPAHPAEPPAVERQAPPVERPAPPPARKEAAPPEPAHKAPERASAKPDH